MHLIWMEYNECILHILNLKTYLLFPFLTKVGEKKIAASELELEVWADLWLVSWKHPFKIKYQGTSFRKLKHFHWNILLSTENIPYSNFEIGYFFKSDKRI